MSMTRATNDVWLDMKPVAMTMLRILLFLGYKVMLSDRNCKVKIQNEILLFRTSHGKDSLNDY